MPAAPARNADLGMAGIEMGGKTGSSQVRRMTSAERSMSYAKRNKMEIPWIERDHALFICFAPYHDPAYAIGVIVEHGMHGATAAAPVARDLMKKVLELNPAGVPLPAAQLATRERHLMATWRLRCGRPLFAREARRPPLAVRHPILLIGLSATACSIPPPAARTTPGPGATALRLACSSR